MLTKFGLYLVICGNSVEVHVLASLVRALTLFVIYGAMSSLPRPQGRKTLTVVKCGIEVYLVFSWSIPQEISLVTRATYHSRSLSEAQTSHGTVGLRDVMTS
uniref:Uncharacterized protein n=1 Tax=Physcomitrium patens TaxID=3218 RepID=A0A7I4ES68_PHYPA